MKQAMKLIEKREIDFAPSEDTWGLKIYRERWQTQSGREKVYWKYDLPDTVVVAPFTSDGKIISIEEFQPGVGGIYPHLVGGTIEDNESPLVTANRELAEETGYLAGKLSLLSVFAHDSGRSERRVHLYLATNCEKAGNGEEWITVNVTTPAKFWDKLMAYLMERPEKVHGGANSLKAISLAFHALGYMWTRPPIRRTA